MWIEVIALLGWLGTIAAAALIGYSRGYINAAKKGNEKLIEYDKLATEFCDSILTERNQYKQVAEAYASQALRVTDVNVKGVGKA